MATTADKVCRVKVACICRGKLKLMMYLLFPRSKMSRPKWPVSWQSGPFPVEQIQMISPVYFRDTEEQSNIVSFGATESQTCKVAQGAINSLIKRRGRRQWVLVEACRTGSLSWSWYTSAGFDVARTGVASVGFIGFPSVGKSTLMSRLTGQHSEGLGCRKP